MTRLSVNINKIALIRNSRGNDQPNVVQVAKDCEHFGAEGITVHPRPDERHIKYQDVRDLKPVVKTELNVEGYPSDDFLDLVAEVKPDQVTLVPDPPDALTSNTGWDTFEYRDLLQDVIKFLKEMGIRTSIFLNPDENMAKGAGATGVDRIELYTEPYVRDYPQDPKAAIAPYIKAAMVAREQDLGINAGHDLNLKNLQYLYQNLPALNEVSIGHALICDALYYGLDNTIQMYLRQLQ